MGSILSREEEKIRSSSSSSLSIENKNSLKQIVNAFRRDTTLITRHHSSTSKTDLTKIEKQEKSLSNRSHSSNEINQIKWKCHLCQLLNDNDSQLCSNCGSTQINVYIPINNNNNQQNNLIKCNDEEKTEYRRSVLIKHKRKADENIVLKHIENLIIKLSISESKFFDKTFPPSLESIFINGNSLSKTTLDLLPDQQTNLTSNYSIQWLRPDQINSSESNHNQHYQWTLFRNPKPNDVLQGALGDCWFITALSVLAEQPEYLMKVLITKEYNYQGIYCVRLCKDGEWIQVLVDDLFPCTINKRLAYSQSHRKQLWVPLIEKALAKLNGSYEAIIAGRCCEGLSTVTGSPCETLMFSKFNYLNDKFNQIWIKLLNSREQKFLMCAMCSNQFTNKQDFQLSGLLNNHAYSLQDLKQSNDLKYKLIKLRNPWGGTHRWNGDWSDNCHLWDENPHLRDELLKEKRSKKDGVFWMPFESFVKYFECVDICKIRPDWYEVRDSANFYPDIGMIQAFYLTIHHLTELDITLYRKISKNLRIQRSEVSLCLAIVNIQQQNNENYRIYSIPFLSQRGQHKFVSTNGYLKQGIYLILPLLFNPINKYLDNTEFNLAVHSSSAIDLERIKIGSNIQREFLIKLCLFYGEQISQGNKNSNEINNDNDDGVKIYELKKYWDGIILLVENRNLNKNVHFHFRCTKSQNAFISRKDSNHQLFDVIPSMYRQIIVTIQRKNASHSFTIQHDFQYNLSSQQFIKNQLFNKQKHYPQIDQSIFNDDIHLPQPISTNK